MGLIRKTLFVATGSIVAPDSTKQRLANGMTKGQSRNQYSLAAAFRNLAEKDKANRNAKLRVEVAAERAEAEEADLRAELARLRAARANRRAS